VTALDAALEYIGEGWRIFPLVGKVPLPGSRGHLDATDDVDQIRRWWAEHPDAEIGGACRASGRIAIDVDVADGKDGLAKLAELERIWGPLPRDCVQRSGRGGLHLVFRDPSPGADGWTRRQDDGGSCHAKIQGSDGTIDIKCNGYIKLASPATRYEWIARGAPPDLPEAWQRPGLIRKLDDERGPGDGVEAWAETVRALDDDQKRELAEYLVTLKRGRGTAATFRAIKSVFHDHGLSVDDGWPFLIGWNARCGVPHGESELRRQLHRVADRELDGDRGWMLDRADDAAAVDALVAEREAEHGVDVAAVTEPASPDCYGISMRDFVGLEDPGDDADRWIVEGVIAAGVPQLIAGPPKSHKTFLLLHLAICIAAGLDWLGRFRVQPGRVLMLPLEDSVRETRRRIWRLCRGLGLDPRDLEDRILIDATRPFRFGSKEDVARLERTVEKYEPALVWIDSLSRTHFGDENSVKEMQVVTAHWSAIAQRYDVAFALIHHFNKTGGGRLLSKIRGSSDLGALARHLVGVEKPESDPHGASLSFEGNLYPLLEPFNISVRDGETDDGKKWIKIEHDGSTQGANAERIDRKILEVLAEVSPQGLYQKDLRARVRGDNSVIDRRADLLVAHGKATKISKKYFAADGGQR
jgi:hypothetical protein